jgi:hypothetical protein
MSSIAERHSMQRDGLAVQDGRRASTLPEALRLSAGARMDGIRGLLE